MRLLDTATLTNQNITTFLLVHTYTATAARDIFWRLFLDQIAGNGTYFIYRTIQRGGAGTAYRSPNATAAVSSGVTSTLIFQGIISVAAGDVIEQYVQGLAGDTTTVDIISEVWEQDYLRPLTAGQFTTDIDASGRVNLGKWLGNAPAALSTNGYVQAMLLRWLTDNAGGTPSALNAGLTQSDVERWLNAVVATPNIAGVPKVDVVDWLGTAPMAPSVAGVPKVDLEMWRGTTPALLSSTLVQVADSAGVTTLLSRLTSTRAGYLDLINTINGAVGVIDGIVDSILLDTAPLPSDPADQSLLIAAISAAQSAITAQTDIIKAKTALIPATPAAVGSQMDLVNVPNATAIGNIQAGLATATALTTLTNRVGAFTGTGVNTVLGFLRAMMRSDLTAPSDVGGTFDPATDSEQALRDRGDAAWTGGGAAPTVTQIRQEMDSNSTQLAAIKAKTDSLTFTVAGKADANMTHVSGDATAADNAESFFDGTGYAGTNNVIPTVTTLTNAPQNSAGVTTLLAIFAGWSGTILNALKAMARKDVQSADLAGTFDSATDSLEALREEVDTLAAVAPITQNEDITES